MVKITLPLIAALLVIPVLSSSVPVSTSPAISIVTVNMAKETSASRILREWSTTPRLHDADILLLQEVKKRRERRASRTAWRMHSGFMWRIRQKRGV